MNRKQLGILLALVIVIGGAGLVLHRRQNASWTGGGADIGKKLLGDFPVNDVTHIAIRQGTNQVDLVKQDEQWRVRQRDGYPADFSKIGDFLIKAHDLKIVQSEQVGPSQLPRLQLAPAGNGSNSALTVEFDGQNNKPIKTLLLGKMHMKSASGAPSGEDGDDSYPDGRYVKTADSTDVAVISDPLDSIQPSPDQWLDKSFFHIDKAKSVEVEFPVATNSWKIERDSDTNEWKLADAKPGEKLDSSKLGEISTPFGSVSFNDVLPGDQLRSAPTSIKIQTFDHFDYTIKVGDKTNDDYLMTVAVAAQIPRERTPAASEKPADKARLDKDFEAQRQKLEDKFKQEQAYAKWTYLVPSWTVDPVLKDRSQLLVVAKKTPKTGSSTNSVSKVESPKAPASTHSPAAS